MSVSCRRCGVPVPAEKRECQACAEDNGFPNVRLAEAPGEQDALTRRLRDAERSAEERGCKETLDRFGHAVLLDSRAVIARSLGVIQDLIEEGRTYTSYHQQLASGARIPEDNLFDRIRTQLESALFPNFYKHVRFGSLGLNAAGISAYGSYVIVLREPLIAHRATVFQENLFVLSQKLGFWLHEPIPQGYRATWAQRYILAKAKLHPEITPSMRDDDFATILAHDRGTTGGSDFIEVHIYGPLNRHTIELVVGPKPKTREDRLIARRLERQLEEVGARLEMS